MGMGAVFSIDMGRLLLLVGPFLFFGIRALSSFAYLYSFFYFGIPQLIQPNPQNQYTGQYVKHSHTQAVV